jgi:hypothetical protein
MKWEYRMAYELQGVTLESSFQQQWLGRHIHIVRAWRKAVHIERNFNYFNMDMNLIL